MRKIIVIYQSKYGYTRTYAEMIASELNCDIRDAAHASAELLQSYDIILFGGGIYASGISGIRLIVSNFDALQKKDIIVWATGLNPGDPEKLQQVWENNIPAEMLRKIHTFYLRGGFDYRKLTTGHKIMITLFKKMLKASKHAGDSETAPLTAFDTPENYCSRDNIADLTACARLLQQASGATGE